MIEFDAEDLYEIVATYAGFGNHLTGTRSDMATTAWLRDVLEDLDAEVKEEPFDFDRFACSIDLRADGKQVPALPLYYSALGQIVTDQIDVHELDIRAVGNAQALPGLLPAPDPGRGLVISIDGPANLPVQCNRVPTAITGQPAVVIAGNWADRVRQGAELSFEASIEPGESANVLAWFGTTSAPAINITTPLTGWTPAAGERGTGLAVALAMAADLAADYRVHFSACSGHEIDHIGLHHHLANRDVAGQPTIHLGASVASVDPESNGPAGLGDRRLSLTTATGDLRAELAERARDANWTQVDPADWAGEGGTWREAGAAVLSFLGSSEVFHTTADTMSATSAEALEIAAEVSIDCARRFLAAHT